MQMSEDRSRFSIKNGDIEITYEGTSSDVNARYAEAFEWIKNAVLTEENGSRKARPKKRKKEEEETGSKKSEKHSEGVASGIDKLITEGWFETDRKNSDVLEELKRAGASGLYSEAIDTRLRSRLKTTLERHQDESGNWLYRKKKT